MGSFLIKLTQVRCRSHRQAGPEVIWFRVHEGKKKERRKEICIYNQIQNVINFQTDHPDMHIKNNLIVKGSLKTKKVWEIW